MDCQLNPLFVFPRTHSAVLPSSHEEWQLLPPAQLHPHRLFSQTNPPHRLCVPILSCVLPESAELCAPFAVSSLLNQSHLFKVNALGNESWQCANGNREFQASTGKDICIKQAGNQFLVKLCRNPRFLTAHGEGRLLMQGQPLVGLGSHGSLDCSDSTLFSSIRLSSLPVSH